MATLFSYFKQSPKTPGSNQKKKSGREEIKIEPVTPNSQTPLKTKLTKEENGKEKENDAVSGGSSGSDIFSGKIVWAKLEGYPWWPSMICEHPRSKLFRKGHIEESKIHVQFFGEPPSRDWVLEKYVKDLKEEKLSSDPQVKYAYEAAKRAEQLDVAKRIEVYYTCKLSDEEDNCSADDGDDDDVIKCSGKRQRNSSSKKPTKRLKLLDDSDDDNNEQDDDGADSSYEPEGEEDEEANDESMESEGDGDSFIATSSDEEERPKKKKKKVASPKGGKKKEMLKNIINITKPTNVTTPISNKLHSSISKAQSTLAKFSPTTSSPASTDSSEGQDFTHFRLPFLQDGKRKDKVGKLHTDPEYDPRTLHVPQSFIDSKECTPGMKQWWALKRDLYDTIIFFKVGKFYELYHMDAVVSVKELGLIYMKGQFAHCGFPEIAFSRYSEVLIQRGYKVARIEQTETPQDLAARKGGKVVRREVCAVISKGTRTFSFMEGDTDNSSNYLLAFVERPSNEICLGGSEFGVCFIDTSIGKFHMGQFSDDRQASRFLTMISQYPPAQVLYERNKVSAKIQYILSHELLPTIKEALVTENEFWSASKTLKHLNENNYFNDEDKSGPIIWPGCLKDMLNDGDTLGLEPSAKAQHAISALGACIWYLKKCCIHQELLSMSKFIEFVPSDNLVVEKRTTSSTLPQHMILDGVSLTNLDIVMNNDGTTHGTLLELLDHCNTPFGKRYFKQWLCMPSCNKRAIQSRLDAVEDLMKLSSVTSKIEGIMKTMPDLERLLRRIHSLGSLRRSTDHPDSRAIMYNDETYSKKKIADLLAAIDGFQKSEKVIGLLQEEMSSLCSPMLKSLLHKDSELNERGRFPKLMPTIKFFQDAFDNKVARETGIIRPKPGVLSEYDDAMKDLKTIEMELEEYLKRQRKRLGCSSIKYWGTGKNRNQLEVPESALRTTPNDYHLASTKKGFKRFYTDDIRELNDQLASAEERRDSALKDTMRSMFNKFDKEIALWENSVSCLATLDCLMCLAHYSSNVDGVSCRPEIIDPIGPDGKEIQPFFEIRECRHPCAGQSLAGSDFIPNDIVLGKKEDDDEEGKHACCVLITGPNMGGKSTLMRQAGVILIMAQLGCYVPAEVCRFTPVDRIFTRLGARDRILHGESTFFIELSETSTIFQHATKHSLVLLDELGRGTATYDGISIASAVVNDLATRIGCRTLFSTHYHTLVDDFSKVPSIKLGHMACMVEKEDEDDDDPSQETITFLYKLSSGPCPKSYGFNAAKLAGLPMPVIKKAYQKAVEFEETSRNMRMFRKLMVSQVGDVKDILSLIR